MRFYTIVVFFVILIVSFFFVINDDIGDKLLGTILNKKENVEYLNKFEDVLNNFKLTFPDSHSKIFNYSKYNNYSGDYFYIDKNNNLVIKLLKSKNNGKLRNELRQSVNGGDNGWDVNKKQIHYLHEIIKLDKIKDERLNEYTFSQIHSEVNPLLRMVVKKERKGLINHIWAVIRINTNNSGRRTNRYDLGKVLDEFIDIKVYAGNKKILIKKNNKVIVDEYVGYWTELKNYFKIGIYDSKNSEGPWSIKIILNELDLK